VSLRAGTSTGSFIALALALAAGRDIAAIRALYQQASARALFTPNPAIDGKAGGHAERTRGIGWRVEHLWKSIEAHYDELVGTGYASTGVMEAARSVLGATTTLAELRPVVVTTLRLADPGAAPPVWAPLDVARGPGGRRRRGAEVPAAASLMDASAESIAMNAQSLLGARYLRVAVPLIAPVALDDCSDAAYAAMDAALDRFYGSPAYAAAVAWIRAIG
jgi:hypothetical protein